MRKSETEKHYWSRVRNGERNGGFCEYKDATHGVSLWWWKSSVSTAAVAFESIY